MTVSEVPCVTVDDCWLDEEGKPIARPKAKKGKPFPKRACGGPGLVWLRNRLTCSNKVCTAEFIGDKC